MRALLFRCASHLCALWDAALNFFAEQRAATTKTSDQQRRRTGDMPRQRDLQAGKREEGPGRPADFWD
jgi:hypothetical protein